MIENKDYPKVIQHFVPNEIMVTIEHQEPLNTYDDVQRILAREADDFGTLFDRNEPLITTFIRPESIKTKYRYVSMLLLRLTSDEELGNDEEKAEATLAFVERFQRRADEEEDDGASIRLVSITPNWFAAPAAHPIATGGPGDFPKPVLPPIDTKKAWHFTPSNNAPAGASEEQKTAIDTMMKAVNDKHEERNQVEVFILDTLPSADGMQNMLRFYPRNVAIQRLFGNGFPKMVESETLKRLPKDYFYGGKYGYKMPDHGVFIAGTVAAMEESADITIVEVMNEWGVGTLQSVLEGLRYVVENRNPKKTTIVNCSFNITVPLSAQQLQPQLPTHRNMGFVENFFKSFVLPPDEADHDKWVCKLPDLRLEGKQGRPYYQPTEYTEAWLVRPLVEVIDIMLEDTFPLLESEDVQRRKLDFSLLRSIFKIKQKVEQRINRLAKSGVLIFGAAGNEGLPGTHPPALYPAAYEKVFGVASLDASSPTGMASYSNQADNPLTQGFLTFGGTTDSHGSVMIDGQRERIQTEYKGMMGIFLESEIPTGFDDSTNRIITEKNTSGWAYWVGTSFATGVMSGMAAALASTMNLQQVLKILRDAKVDHELTDADEVEVEHG